MQGSIVCSECPHQRGREPLCLRRDDLADRSERGSTSGRHRGGGGGLTTGGGSPSDQAVVGSGQDAVPVGGAHLRSGRTNDSKRAASRDDCSARWLASASSSGSGTHTYELWRWQALNGSHGVAYLVSSSQVTNSRRLATLWTSFCQYRHLFCAIGVRKINAALAYLCLCVYFIVALSPVPIFSRHTFSSGVSVIAINTYVIIGQILLPGN